jgi:hypothetical protein
VLEIFTAEFMLCFMAKVTLSEKDKATLRRIMKKVRAIKIAKMKRGQSSH